MLWYKGWLETRVRTLFALAFIGFLLYTQHSSPLPALHSQLDRLQFSGQLVAILVSALLGGAGIVTQPSFQATKGLHGSILFTLSMPVSRLRLLAVRAGLGALEASVVLSLFCCGVWIASPMISAAAAPFELFQQTATLIACASSLYCLSVLLATFLEEQLRVVGTMVGCYALQWLCLEFPVPAPINIFRAMGKDSPMIAHTIPWTPMAYSLALSAILLFAALKIAQSREY